MVRLGIRRRTSADADGERRARAVHLSDTQRTEAFSDGVFAIAITLLVLGLVPPHIHAGGLLDGLIGLWPAYVAYVTSFTFIGVIWFNHHQAFTCVRFVDRGLHAANLAILFTTAVLPFPTVVLASTVHAGNLADARTAITFYALVGSAMCLSWIAFFWHLQLHDHLVEEEVNSAYFRYETLRYGVAVGLYLVAAVAGWLITPVVALAIFTVIPPLAWVTTGDLRGVPAHPRPLLRR
jgi:uncharacterized membrane protein